LLAAKEYSAFGVPKVDGTDEKTEKDTNSAFISEYMRHLLPDTSDIMTR
jgi:hypothetical protein